MSPAPGRLGDLVRSQDPVEVGVLLAGLVAALVLVGAGLLTRDTALPGLSATPADDSDENVVVVIREGSVDGLFARSFGHAVLTVPRSPVRASLVADVQRLDPTRLVVLGGPDVISADIAADLSEATRASVTRLAGADRYATAARAAVAMYRAPVREVLIAASEPSSDAAAASGRAPDGIPVLLVTRDSLPTATARALRRLQPQRLTIVDPGGDVSDAVQRELRRYTTGAIRRVPAV